MLQRLYVRRLECHEDDGHGAKVRREFQGCLRRHQTACFSAVAIGKKDRIQVKREEGGSLEDGGHGRIESPRFRRMMKLRNRSACSTLAKTQRTQRMEWRRRLQPALVITATWHRLKPVPPLKSEIIAKADFFDRGERVRIQVTVHRLLRKWRCENIDTWNTQKVMEGEASRLSAYRRHEGIPSTARNRRFRQARRLSLHLDHEISSEFTHSRCRRAGKLKKAKR